MEPENGMENRWQVADVFAAIDRQDAPAFAAFLTENCVFRFGNAPPVAGRQAIEKTVAGFFDSLRSISHDVCAVVETGGRIACHGKVTYVRQDGSSLSVPFADFFTLREGKIGEYLIFADVSGL